MEVGWCLMGQAWRWMRRPVLVFNNPQITPPARLRAALNLLRPMMSTSTFLVLVIQGA
jgi:hypothetical protein